MTFMGAQIDCLTSKCNTTGIAVLPARIGHETHDIQSLIGNYAKPTLMALT